MKYFILLSIAAQLCSNAYPQGLDANWVFGDSVGLKFEDDGSFNIFNSKMSAYEASASISDSMGNLLFYSNGEKVWNKNNEIMMNGENLEIGLSTSYGSSLTQGVIILPDFDGNKLYYIFYIAYQFFPTENYGLRYAVVDMSLDGGLGEVVEKNVSIYDDITTEKLQAVKHANGRDWWLLTRQWNNDVENLNELQFIRYLITPDSIKGPYFQNYGPGNEWTTTNFGSTGEMVFSPQGYKLAYTAGSNLDIYDFDRCNGQLSNVQTIYDLDEIGIYSCAFSPDGNKVYVSTYESKKLYQYCLNCNEVIDSTQELIYNIGGSYVIAQMELGPDDKIYIATPYFSMPSDVYSIKNKTLCVINNPNELGLACDFDTNTVFLGVARTLYGLPNMPNYNLGALAGSGCDTLTNVMQIIESNNIQIYPNPAKDYFIISGEIKAGDIIKIYSADGRVVLQEKINTTNTKVDISKLPPGVYVIQISEDGWVKYSEKLFK
ncbi:MAG: T9SS type A sorting domain-containing protein [Bacteroidetes bacterium]|nr:T9SS type A sorting domain-containing protein [Bacteroidota bacterium]